MSTTSTAPQQELVAQIVKLHNPDVQSVNVRPYLCLVERVINETVRDNVEGHAMCLPSSRDLEVLAPLVIEIQCQITKGQIGSIDDDTTAKDVLKSVSHFSWEAKAVLTMAAIASNYKDCLLLNHYSPLQVPLLLVVSRLNLTEAIVNLSRTMLETTRNIVVFQELSTNYILDKDAEVRAAPDLLPTAVYWVVRSAVAAIQGISSFTSVRWDNFGYDVPAIEKPKSCAHQLELVTREMHELVDKKMEQKIKMVIYETVRMDNLPVLKLLTCDEELYDCQAKTRVHLDVLKGRNVLLLISGLDITNEELHKLEQIYTERTHAYDIVWIPVIDPPTHWTHATRAKFKTMQASMPWYTICDPKYFQGKPIIVVLDPLGKVMNPNAIHMMWIWRSNAFPFTRAREEDLWQKQTWNLEFLVDADQRILEWIREGKYIILYGTGRLKWIRDFTTRAKEIASNLQVPVEMVYVGKSHHKYVVQKLSLAIAGEQLSHCWLDPNQLWYFWTRLESMFHSKMQLGRIGDQNDITLQELQRLRSFYKGHEGWAILAKGSNIIVSAQGRLALTVLKENDKWEQRARKEGLEVAFAAHCSELYKEEYICSRIVFPITAKTPDHMPCPECLREMLKFKTFRCCHGSAMSGSSTVDN
ncbi:hypothetical protein Cgig2_005425 [Carnegiea gigantea]|uniref:Protein SIEVE ELEMENT OCCLUSION B n=1 Tax=Carnegiea gigantea TaxID=171969 RepID=A0A9Q1KD25_9CARY|nr:hypothetical protein Cgig2_005425 [Carnegiea gigantea]